MWGALYEGIKLKSRGTVAYYSVFVVRRQFYVFYIYLYMYDIPIY